MLFAFKSFSQQTVSERVKYFHVTSKCKLCGKLKKDNSVDWINVSDKDVSDKIYLETLSSGVGNMLFGSKETNCSGSRFGEHDYREVSRRTEFKLVTAKKGSAAKRQNSDSEDENSNESTVFDLKAAEDSEGKDKTEIKRKKEAEDERKKKDEEENKQRELKIREALIDSANKAKKKSEFEECQEKLKSIKNDIQNNIRSKVLELFDANPNKNLYKENSSKIVEASNDNFEEVEIGDQIWMKSNLTIKHFQNGDPIPEAKNRREWDYACLKKLPVYCNLEFDSNNEKFYGLYYNYYALIDKRNITPIGWRIPLSTDFNRLFYKLELNGLAIKLISNESWDKRIEYFKKNNFLFNIKSEKSLRKEHKKIINSSNFSATLGGNFDDGYVRSVGYEASWWVTYPSDETLRKFNFAAKSVQFNDINTHKYIDLSLNFLNGNYPSTPYNCPNTSDEIRDLIGYRSGFNIRCIKVY